MVHAQGQAGLPDPTVLEEIGQQRSQSDRGQLVKSCEERLL